MGSAKTAILDQFGQLLISQAYDRAAWYLEHVFDGHMKGPRQVALATLYRSLDERSQDAVRQFATEAIQTMLAEVLNCCYQFQIEINYTASNGQKVNICEISDLIVGELFSEYGWVARYSKYKDGLNWPPTEPVPELTINEGDIIVGLDDDDGELGK